MRSQTWKVVCTVVACICSSACMDGGLTPMEPDDVDFQRGQNLKVTVCHIPRGNANARLIDVSVNAVGAHRDHGDALSVCLVINEVMFDPTGAQGGDSRGEYVELFNPSDVGIDLRSAFANVDANSLKISDNGSSTPDYFKSLDNTYPLTVPPGGYAVVYDNGSSGSAVPTVHSIPAAAVQARVDDAAIGGGLNNSGDAVRLFTADLSVTIDEMNYDGSLADGNGMVLQRCRGGTFVEGAPTPGAANVCG